MCLKAGGVISKLPNFGAYGSAQEKNLLIKVFEKFNFHKGLDARILNLSSGFVDQAV